MLIDTATGVLTGWVHWKFVRVAPAWLRAHKVEAFRRPEFFAIGEDIRRQIELEVCWVETDTPQEEPTILWRKLLSMRLRKPFCDAAGAVIDMEVKQRRLNL